MNLGSRLARQNNTNRKDWMHKLHQCPLQGWDGQWRLAWWGSALPLPIMVIPCPIMARLCSVFQECWAPLETLDSQWTDIYRHTFFWFFAMGQEPAVLSSLWFKSCSTWLPLWYCLWFLQCPCRCRWIRQPWLLKQVGTYQCSPMFLGWWLVCTATCIETRGSWWHENFVQSMWYVCDFTCFFFMLMSCHIYNIIQVISWYFMSEIVRICWVAPWMLGPADLHLLDVFGGCGRAA